MEERDRRRQQRERESIEAGNDKYTVNGKLKKKYAKKLALDANTTTSQAVLGTGIGKSSKKINYDALQVPH